METWPLARAADFDASGWAVPAGPTPLPAQADSVAVAATPPTAAGIEGVPVLALVSPAEAPRLEAKLGGEFEVDSAAGL
ncbi:MAG: hypothetical protein ABSF14_12975 [Terriglobia bacterium]